MHKINILFNAILAGGAMETLHNVPLDEIVKAIGQAVIAIIAVIHLLRKRPKE
jgi:hypothetical protein